MRGGLFNKDLFSPVKLLLDLQVNFCDFLGDPHSLGIRANIQREIKPATGK